MNKIEYEISIVKADTSHFEGICRVENECFADPWSEQSIFDTLSLPEYVYFVAQDELGEIAGYVAMYRALDEAHIVNVAVLPKFRRMGIADKLLKKMKDYGLFESAEPAAVFYLEVRESNTAAIELYRKHGFTENGVRKNYYRNPTENAVLMSFDYLDAAENL